MHDIFFKTAVSLVSGVRNNIFQFSPVRHGPGYICVHFDLNLYSFAIFFCQSKVAHVKMNAPSLVFAKKRYNKKEQHLKCLNFIADLYFRNVLEGFPFNICLITSSFGRQIIV